MPKNPASDPRGHDEVPSFSDNALRRMVDDVVAAISAASDLEVLREIVSQATRKSAALSMWKRELGKMEPNERPRIGEAINAAFAAIALAAKEQTNALERTERRDRLSADRLDLTETIGLSRVGHLHVVSQIREELEDIFLGMGYEIVEGPEIETEWYNFSALNMPRDHPARSIQDSFYLDLADRETMLLRSQTSPAQIRLLERGELPIYAVAPGRVYRRDTADASHLPIFHQIEGLVVDRGVQFSDLAGTIDSFVRAIFGESVNSRLRPGYFPFTEPSAEFDVTCAICGGEGCRTCQHTGWVELGGCGMVHPAVFEATDVNPEEWTGFAFGFGIDRLAMMRYGIRDIRSFLENDVRFLAEF